MTQKSLLKRFRAEIRDRNDIFSGAHITVTQDSRRSANVKVLKLLLKQVFDDRFTLNFNSKGLLVGSRDEFQSLTLQSYTQRKSVPDMLLKSLTKSELELFYQKATGEDIHIFVPENHEQSFISSLEEEFPSVRYGL